VSSFAPAATNTSAGKKAVKDIIKSIVTMTEKKFELVSQNKPAGDQPQAIAELVSGLKNGFRDQTLLGVTGSGKTFTIANVIAEIQKPTLVIAHNKTLAAQLTNEFRELFPHNSVNYFVSYYDYYQPEAYIPTSDTYIDKEALINDEIDKLRHAATMALLTRRDVIVVASVSCIYGLGAPETYAQNIFHFKVGDEIDRKTFARKLVELQFTRTNADLKRSTYRLHGDHWEIMPPDREAIYDFELSNGVIKAIYEVDPVRGFRPGRNPTLAEVYIAPAKHFITEVPERDRAIKAIRQELKDQLALFDKEKKFLEAERLERRTKFDLAMMREVGYCHGIENYSRHLSHRSAGEPLETLLDYFAAGNKIGGANPPEFFSEKFGRAKNGASSRADFLTVIDESHMTVPQLQGMFNGDASRKKTLIEYGFRLPSAADNRPLRFPEFEARINQIIYTSATPGPYELKRSKESAEALRHRGVGVPPASAGIVQQVIRPTGLVDPKITIRPARGQVDDLIPRIEERVMKKALDGTRAGERVLITTLTKQMAEDLSTYLEEKGVKVNYLHSDVKTLDRIKILTDLRKGKIEVLVGVNLLREGLDLPEVSLVAILDADKEGFLRSETSLVQTIGRASRNVEGEVLIYADHITGSIQRAVKETERRRKIQLAYNKKHGITPKTIVRKISSILPDVDAVLALEMKPVPKSKTALKELIADKEREMRNAAKHLDFELAGILRDEIRELAKKTGK
jgi:excinuclease ABC subunit B